jgi:hypothetical protein
MTMLGWLAGPARGLPLDPPTARPNVGLLLLFAPAFRVSLS